MKSRNTQQKELLSKELNKIDTFFSAEDLHSKTKNISLAAIYRFLKELKNKEELYSYVCNRRTVYSKERKSHCHFTCEKTGKVIHFEIDNIDFLKNKVPGKITSFQLEVRGICNDCQNN